MSDASRDTAEGGEVATAPLQRLLELQHEDSRADQLRYQAAHSPARQALRALEAEEAKLKVDVATVAPTRAPLEARQAELEAEIAETGERIAGIDARLRSAESGSYRDQQAMSLEMDSLSRRRRELEDQELEVMEALEPLEEALAMTAEAHRVLEAERERLNTVIEEETRALVSELHEVTARREAIAAGLPTALLSEYERLRAHNNGIGAAHLVHGTCSGCNLALSATELDRVRHAPPEVISHCEQCGRILVP